MSPIPIPDLKTQTQATSGALSDGSQSGVNTYGLFGDLNVVTGSTKATNLNSVKGNAPAGGNGIAVSAGGNMTMIALVAMGGILLWVMLRK